MSSKINFDTQNSQSLKKSWIVTPIKDKLPDASKQLSCKKMLEFSVERIENSLNVESESTRHISKLTNIFNIIAMLLEK